KEALNSLDIQGISSKLDDVIACNKQFSGDILQLNDSLENVISGIKKLRSSLGRLAEKTSKRMKIIRTIQIATFVLLLLYIAYDLYQKFLF
ncbi:MAG: hypothetical protein LBP72_03700, partial [Dysgonamonadaceae bacterium]|nr:hypothetical protein [Dysgonamonadaceae bacterium]